MDEKSPPEDAYDEHGHPTSFEEDKSEMMQLSVAPPTNFSGITA